VVIVSPLLASVAVRRPPEAVSLLELVAEMTASLVVEES
jgi:hypothetical protein